jgi:protein associated with RNAse G/E
MFRWRKWDESPHWVHECIFLGSDAWGDWLGQLPGWASSRPGRDFDVRHPNVTLMAASGDWVYTSNAFPHRTRVYIDIATEVGWEGGEPVGIDMDLDVVEHEDRGVFIDDRDEWDEHRAELGYPVELVDRLEALALDLERRVAASEPPFDETTRASWFRRLAELTDA